MQDKQWYQVLTVLIAAVALIVLIPVMGQTASGEQTVTVYKTPT